MNIRLFGTTVWGDDPPLLLAESVKQREEEFERELIKQELDLIDAGARKEALRMKIVYLRSYSGASIIREEGVLKQLKQASK